MYVYIYIYIYQASACFGMRSHARTPPRMPKTLETRKKKHVLFD